MASYIKMNEQILHEEDVRLLITLMQSFSDRWRDIGMELGFTHPELNQIEKNPMLLTTAPKSFMTELLSQWVQWPTKDHHTKPTLGALCDALGSSLVGLGSLAEKVESEMKTSTTGHCRSISSKVQKLTLSPEVEEDLRQRIHTDVKKMRDKFSTLQTMIRNNIKRNTDCDDLAAHVSGMYILSEEHEKQVGSASTIDKIFYILTKYWSFLDFSNLENIAKTFCCDYDTIKKLDQYKHDVQQFCERRVSEFPQGSLNNGADIEGMDKLVIILDKQDLLLKHVLNLKEVIANILGQPASKLVLYDIGTGSVVVTFLVATSISKKLFTAKTLTQKQKVWLLEANVVSLKFKEMSIYEKGPTQTMASNPSPEVKSILIQTPDLTTALANKPLSIAEILLNKGFVSSEIMLKMLIASGSYTPTEKAAILIKAVRNTVKLAPSKFIELLEILSEVTWCKEVVESLHSTYKRMLEEEASVSLQKRNDIGSRIEQLEDQFGQLRLQLMAELNSHSIPVNRLVEALMSLPLSLRNIYESSIRSRLPTLTSKGTTTDDFFIIHLNPLMSFIDYDLLAYLISMFGSDTLKKDMHSYESNLQIFKKQTTIEQLIDHFSGQPEIPPKFSLVEAQIRKCTLEQLDTIRHRYYPRVQLSKIMFQLVAVVDSN